MNNELLRFAIRHVDMVEVYDHDPRGPEGHGAACWRNCAPLGVVESCEAFIYADTGEPVEPDKVEQWKAHNASQ